MVGIPNRAIIAGAAASLLAASIVLAPCPAAGPVAKPKALVIAHRGASGYRPEHTLEAYELAIELGADFIEPDLCPSKDGILVARHENDISGTTDVADHPEFARRKTKKMIDGESKEGWFSEDFTLAELRTLHARERMPDIRQRNTIYNDHYRIPTFQEIIDLVKRKSQEQHRQIGIYPEAKHPSYFASIGLPNEKPLIDMLHKNGYKDSDSPIFIQCFEPGALKRMQQMTKLPLIQLIDEEGKPYDWVLQKDKRSYKDMLTESGLKEVASYARGIGPNKNLVIPRDKNGKLMKPSTLVANAHKAGLKVHPWTFRNENAFLPADLRHGTNSEYGDIFGEYRKFFDLDVDGVFSENPDTALEARDKPSK